MLCSIFGLGLVNHGAYPPKSHEKCPTMPMVKPAKLHDIASVVLDESVAYVIECFTHVGGYPNHLCQRTTKIWRLAISACLSMSQQQHSLPRHWCRPA